MALSYETYTSDGSTPNFVIPFDYIAKSHVTATKNGVSAPFTWVSGSLINITAGVVAADVIVVRRTTPSTPLFNSSDGSVLTNSNLQTLGRQAIFLTQENQDLADTTLALAQAAIDSTADDVVAAAAQVALAQAQVVLATAQTAAATAQAVIATTQSGIATAQASAAVISAAAALASEIAAAASAGVMNPTSNIPYSGNNTHSGTEGFSGAATFTGDVSVLDSKLVIKDDADPTKAVKFQVSGVTAGQTRVMTVPNFDATLATVAGIETLANKTLTAPVIASMVSGGLTVTVPALTSTLLTNATSRVAINSAYGEYTSNADLSTAIPSDDTVPQVSEGTEILSVAITTRAAANKVRVSFQCSATNGSGSPDSMCFAVFRNGGTNAIASRVITNANNNYSLAATITFEDSPGSAATHTYTIRVGASATVMRLNGTTTVRQHGGAQRATLLLEEIA